MKLHAVVEAVLRFRTRVYPRLERLWEGQEVLKEIDALTLEIESLSRRPRKSNGAEQ